MNRSYIIFFSKYTLNIRLQINVEFLEFIFKFYRFVFVIIRHSYASTHNMSIVLFRLHNTIGTIDNIYISILHGNLILFTLTIRQYLYALIVYHYITRINVSKCSSTTITP